MIVHGFRNASDADVRFLNLHAPGVGFITYMREMRDGQPVSYDQYDPPDDGGADPAGATFGEWPDEPDIKVFEDRACPDGPQVALSTSATPSSTCSRAR